MSDAGSVAYWRVRGVVQGVGFRWFVSREARGLDLAGWVCNADSGDVHVLAAGPGKDLAALKQRIMRGPPRSRVESIDEMESEPPVPPTTPFSIIP
jgi:acylphosphatase